LYASIPLLRPACVPARLVINDQLSNNS
jgi:hypothetical protein